MVRLSKFKEKKIIVFLIVITTIINIIAASYIFVNIQIMEAPDATINLDIVEINSDEAIITTVMDVFNPNDFEVIARDIKIVTTTMDGKEVSHAFAKGGAIPPKKNRIFSSTSHVRYNGQDPDILKSLITGEMGMKIWFIEKTLPFSMNVITTFSELIDNLLSPDIDTKVNFGEITQDHVNVSFLINVYNPNSLNATLKDIKIEVRNEEDVLVGSLNLPDSLIVAKNNTIIEGNGTIDIEALNANELIVNMESTIVGHIAGYDKAIPVNVKTTLVAPDLESLLPSTFPTNTVIRTDYRASLFGLISDITLEAHNPNNIEFSVKDIAIEVYRIDKNTRRKVSEGVIKGGIIKANDVTILKGSVRLPYRKLLIPPLGGRILPEWLEVIISANVTIQGLNSYFWVGMVSYQDFHFLKRDKVYKNPETVDWM